MRILFARHGESVANLLGVISNRDLPHPLTEAGREQAASLAEWVRPYSLTRVFSSPVLRAVQTADIVGQTHHLPVAIADALREFDCGVLEGRSDEESWARHAALSAEWHAGRLDSRIEGGESLNDMRARFVPFVGELMQQYRGSSESLLAVGHGGLYRWMLPLVVPGLESAFQDTYRFGYTGCLVTEPGDGGLVCVGWRET